MEYNNTKKNSVMTSGICRFSFYSFDFFNPNVYYLKKKKSSFTILLIHTKIIFISLLIAKNKMLQYSVCIHIWSFKI